MHLSRTITARYHSGRVNTKNMSDCGSEWLNNDICYQRSLTPTIGGINRPKRCFLIDIKQQK